MAKTKAAPEAHDRVRDLRIALGLTQEQLAERAGLERIDIVKVENGHNKASSYAMRSGLSRGFGLALEELVDLLEGRLSAAGAKRRIQANDEVRRATGTG